jgi:hypothetical protein
MRNLLALFTVALFIGGCEGDTGPIGPAGNANVRAGTISPTSAEWICCSYWGMTTEVGTVTVFASRYVEIPISAITPDIIAKGAVLVFFEAETGSDQWTTLPFEILHYTLAYYIDIAYEVEEGIIRLHYFIRRAYIGATLPELSSLVIPTYNFKYVVIEGMAFSTLQAGGVNLSETDRIIEYTTLP